MLQWRLAVQSLNSTYSRNATRMQPKIGAANPLLSGLLFPLSLYPRARRSAVYPRARRSAVILVFTAGAAALLGAAAAWFAACAGGRVRALCQRAIPSTAAFDPVTLTKGEYALLLAFLQAPAGSVRRRGRRK